MSSPVDEKYYREVLPGGAAERFLISARNRIFQDFKTHTRPSQSDQVLDVGVSDVVNDGANVLERSYEHQKNITACGLGAGTQFKKAFPLVRYVQIEPNVPLPFDDDTFHIATSNAVLEQARDENLILMTRKRLRQLAAPIKKKATIGYTGLLLGPFSSDLYLVFH
jgi:hypothetical protein